MHLHVNHIQIQDDISSWHRSGDWVDTFQGIGVLRTLLDTFAGQAMIHCHIAEHAEVGMLGTIHIHCEDDEVTTNESLSFMPLEVQDHITTTRRSPRSRLERIWT